MATEGTDNGLNAKAMSLRQLAAEGRAPAAENFQKAWSFAAGNEAQVIEMPTAGKVVRERGRLRTDARRTTEYLATRGKTPAEALHDVAGMKWQRAIKEIKRHAKCSELDAMKLWLACNQALLPYTAARYDTLELGSQLAGSAGNLSLAHFLAASMVAERLGVAGAAPSLSPEHQSFDTPKKRALPLLDGDGPGDGTAIWPDKPAD